MSALPILIVGAGPTGLVLALHLARRGVAFRIISDRAGPGEASRAMAVHARTLEFYRQLGFAEEVVAQGVKIEAAHIRQGGEDVARLALKDIGGGLSPYPFVLGYPQDDHERFLIERLKAAGVEVEWNVSLADFTQDDSRVRATLDHAGRRESADFAYLCGCDGAHSRVRHVLGVEFPGGTYEHLYYVADVQLAAAQSEDLYAHLAEGSFALMLPVRSRGMWRLIGVAAEDPAPGQQLTFEDIRPAAERLLGVTAEKLNWFSTYRVHHRVAARFQVGRCFLAGDAGHVHSPAGGQGMNTGIGDAVNLSWKLAQAAQGRADARLLATYESERIGFARTLVASTDRAFQYIVSGGLGGRLLRSVLVPYVLPFLAGFSAARKLMFETVSQVRIAYRDSALSAGQAGDIHGGDRLPWAGAGGADNFAPLRTLDWQVHVYGEAAAPVAETLGRLGLPLHSFAFHAAAEAAGLRRDALYLIRPDGYVALAGAKCGAIADYARRLGLRFGTAA